MTDRFQPIVWELIESGPDRPEVRVKLNRGRDGSVRYAVCADSVCLSKGGKWDYEPLPSHRTAAWLKRHHFDSLEEAQAAAVKAWEAIVKQRALAKKKGLST